MTDSFLAIDGDDVGRHLEYLVLINDAKTLTTYSREFNAAMQWLEAFLIEYYSATVLFSGGDNLLARLPQGQPEVERLEVLRGDFSERSHSTVSVGVGATMREAYFALKFAKTSGKNQVKYFEELTND